MSYCAVYLNRIHREKNLPEKPEDPLILEKSIPSDGEFTFIDIVPSVLTYSSTAHEVEYHRFSHLIETANKWLEKNTQWNIINCETVRLSYRHNVTSMVSRWEQQINPVTPLWSPISRGEFETSLKALRLWIRRKDQFDNEFTLNDDIMFNDKYRILKYLDFIPKRLNENSFETIDQVLERINARLKQSDTLFWNIITLESLKIEANSEWEIDTELCLFDESSRHLMILRLFYEEYNSPNDMINYDFNSNDDYPYTMIGIEDFTPNLISAGSFFKRPIFEPFCTLTQRASRWLNSECVDYFLNAQSIDVKLKSASRIETRNCTNIEQGNFIQFLRIVYCKLFSRNDSNNNTNTIQKLKPYDTITSMNQEFFNQLSDTMQLCSKVFVATKLDHPLDSMQQRIYNWLHLVNNYNNNKNLCILGAETITIYGKDDDEKSLEKKTSECFHGNRFGSLNCFQFKAIRLYYCQLPINNFENDNDNIFNIGDNGVTNKSIKNYYYRTGSTKTFQKKKIQTNNQINSSDISKDKGLQRRNSKLKLSRSNSYRLMLKNNDYNDPNPTVSNDNNNQVKTMVDGRKFGFFKKNFSKKHLKRSQSNNNYNKIRDNSHNQSLTYCNCM